MKDLVKKLSNSFRSNKQFPELSIRFMFFVTSFSLFHFFQPLLSFQSSYLPLLCLHFPSLFPFIHPCVSPLSFVPSFFPVFLHSFSFSIPSLATSLRRSIIHFLSNFLPAFPLHLRFQSFSFVSPPGISSLFPRSISHIIILFLVCVCVP